MSSAESSLDGVRTVVVSTEQPGARMAGPAIRAVHLARALQAAGADVRLATPELPDVDLGVEATAFGSFSADAFRRLSRGTDVIVSQPLRVDVARGLHGGGARVIYDLYVPSFVEYPAAHGGEERPPAVRDALIARNQMEYATAVACGDAFICASERQRDHWLGALGQCGRIYPIDDLPGAGVGPPVAIVPFGLPDAAPTASAEPAVRGVLVPSDSVILLWTGGLWNWFDPVTLLRGLRAAADADPRIRLVVMGAGHASDDWSEHRAAAAAMATADDLGLIADGHLVVAGRWVPFEERAAFLTDADIGVCSYYASDETRLSFRTRYLDHLWAGLPTLSTAGGSLTDQMVAAGAAVAVPPGDVPGWTSALLALAADADRRATMSSAARGLAESFRWSVVSEPLVDLIAGLDDVPPGQAPGALTTARYFALAARNRLDAVRSRR
ncbi:MAG: glycosyltransferase [Candidatus Nanopelagicales bacterium]